jgi:hypothetical protein
LDWTIFIDPSVGSLVPFLPPPSLCWNHLVIFSIYFLILYLSPLGRQFFFFFS